MSLEIQFHSVDEILTLHRKQIDLYGGSHGVRDHGLLESAVMAPQQTFGGEFLYKSLQEMAVAYWIGLVGNHPFIDGNKRVGFLAMDTFLLVNGFESKLSFDEAWRTTIEIAMGSFDRESLVELITLNSRPI